MNQTRSAFDLFGLRIVTQHLPPNCQPSVVKPCERYQEEVYRVEGRYNPGWAARMLGAKPVEGVKVKVPGLSGRIHLTDCIIDFGTFTPQLGGKFESIIFGTHDYQGVLPLRCICIEKNIYQCSVDNVQDAKVSPIA